jgi:hypothetical protein
MVGCTCREGLRCLYSSVSDTYIYCGIFAQGKNCEASRQLLLGNGSANTPVSRQQIRNTQQWSNWEVFSTRSVRQLRDATLQELLGKVFPMRPVKRVYEEQLRLRVCLETVVRIAGGWCETAARLGVSCDRRFRTCNSELQIV